MPAVKTLIVAAAVFASLMGQSSQPGLTDRSALTLHEGDLVVNTNGAIVEDLELRGTLFIEGTGVVVRNVWVYDGGFWGILVTSGSAIIENVEIGHAERAPMERGIGGDNIVASNLDIHHVEDGIKLGSNTSYRNVWVHDLDSTSADPHADAVQLEGGESNAVVADSILDATGRLGNGNAAVQIGTDLGPIDGILFENNDLNGGAYTVFVDDSEFGPPMNISFVDNRFGPDHSFGHAHVEAPIFGSGNVDEQGRPVEFEVSRPTEVFVPDVSVATAPAPVAVAADEPAEDDDSIGAWLAVSAFAGLAAGIAGMTTVRWWRARTSTH